jgi:mono/diheme cytochrome c family protein
MTLLEGRRNMPAFGGNGDMGLFFAVPTLTDDQIAAVINYVRSSFGNHFKGRITAAEVKALRRPTTDKLLPAR